MTLKREKDAQAPDSHSACCTDRVLITLRKLLPRWPHPLWLISGVGCMLWSQGTAYFSLDAVPNDDTGKTTRLETNPCLPRRILSFTDDAPNCRLTSFVLRCCAGRQLISQRLVRVNAFHVGIIRAFVRLQVFSYSAELPTGGGQRKPWQWCSMLALMRTAYDHCLRM